MTNQQTAPASPDAAYAALEAQFARLWAFHEASGILQWDGATMMPDGAAEMRGETSAALAGAAHGLLTDPRVSDWLDLAETAPDPDAGDADAAWRRANLREMRRSWAHAVAEPAELVEAREKAAAACEMVWRKARPDSDFAALAPSLSEVLRLARESAAAKSEALGLPPYDALMDGFEPGASTATIEPVFDELAAFLPGFLDDVLSHQGPAPEPLPGAPFPAAAQEALGRRMMAAAGFDFNRGRLDVSLHPFCGGASNDVRITTRYDETDPLSGLFGVLHETGHALYELGRPAQWMKQPVGSARGMTLHESQSLLIEMQVARGPEFLSFAAPIIAEMLGRPANDPAFAAEALGARARRVERGFIRVEADEVTYPLHVILRMRLEKAMILGELELADLPGAWNDGMRDLLGVTPPEDRLGCLQDIHWPAGLWGYFPTYTLGALAAAQLYEAALAAEPEIPSQLARGDFSALLGWMGENVHAKGSSAPTQETLEAATGAPLQAKAFISRLRSRYGD